MRHLKKLGLGLALAIGLAGSVAIAQAPGGGMRRAPIDDFVGYPNFRGADISPNGRYIAGVRHEPNGDVLIVLDWETKRSTAIQRASTASQTVIEGVEFKSDGRLLFTLLQRIHVVPGSNSMKRNETIDDAYTYVARVYATNLDGSGLLSLYDPSEQQGLPRYLSANVVDSLDADPEHVLIAAPRVGGAELWKVNITTGAHVTVDRGEKNTFNWVLDRNGAAVLREDAIAGGRGTAWYRRAAGTNAWTEVARFLGADRANGAPSFQGVGPAVEANQVFVIARQDNADTGGLYVFDTSTGQYTQEILSVPGFDVSNAVRDVRNHTILAGCYYEYKYKCVAKDDWFRRNWNGVSRALGDNVNVYLQGRGQHGARWLLRTEGPQDPGTFWVYDTQTRSLEPMATERNTPPELLPTETVVHYTTSDGQQQWGYLWLPPGANAQTRNLPMVVVPHGGPEGRDIFGFDPMATWLASQGYAAFQPNFRGGGDFGRKFTEAGWRQWGQRMQDDVSDGVRYLVGTGAIDPNRMCMMGWSHGGYMAFTASFQNVDLYKCAIAGAGISDLVAMQRWVRDGIANERDVIDAGGQGRQSISYKYWTRTIGDMDSDRAMLSAHSAAQNVERVGMPLLMIHGDQDQTVPIQQSEIMQRAMRAAGKDVRLVTLTDMDHYYTPDNGPGWRMALTEAVAFVRQNIGPGYEPPAAASGAAH